MPSPYAVSYLRFFDNNLKLLLPKFFRHLLHFLVYIFRDFPTSGTCDDLRLDGAASSGGMGGKLQYAWELYKDSAVVQSERKRSWFKLRYAFPIDFDSLCSMKSSCIIPWKFAAPEISD